MAYQYPMQRLAHQTQNYVKALTGQEYTYGEDDTRIRKAAQQEKTPESTEKAQATSDNKLSKGFDWRARLRPKGGSGNAQFWGTSGDTANSLLGPIKQSNGLIWQYTPSITYNASVNYHKAQMQGMNYPINTYNMSTVESLDVTSELTASDIYEARYMLSAMHFLKVFTKSYFGEQAGELYGTPPPVMLFEYLGDHLFHKVPVVISGYNITFADSVDYVPVELNGSVTYVPTQANFTVSLLPTYNPSKLRTKFDLEKLKSGEAYKDGFV